MDEAMVHLGDIYRPSVIYSILGLRIEGRARNPSSVEGPSHGATCEDPGVLLLGRSLANQGEC